MSSGASILTLGNLVRGVRQAAGYTAAVSHLGGAPGNLACSNPTLNGSASSDHPPSRHPVGATTYDSKRGRIWQAWGYSRKLAAAGYLVFVHFPDRFLLGSANQRRLASFASIHEWGC